MKHAIEPRDKVSGYLVIDSKKFGLIKVLIDLEDSWLAGYRWCANPQGKFLYARNSGLGLMHRYLMGNPDSLVDHVNRNTFDNRKSNLRLTTRSLNQANSRRVSNKSKYKGVMVEDRYRTVKYRAQISYRGAQYHGPTRTSEVEAAMDYNLLAIKHFGEFALLNVIDEINP